MTASAYECAALLLDTVPGLMRAIANAMRQRYGDDGDMPTMVQLRMLAMLAARPWSLGELAAAHQVTPSSMSRTVDVLVQREWVARTPVPGDRRKVVLCLTPAGHAAHAAVVHAARDVAAALLAQLDAHDRAHLYEGLSALRALLNTSCPLPPGSASGEIS
ncbi:MAG: MarR family winged helix-turn-helix transcriptional regulator [Roseiflexus sp.]